MNTKYPIIISPEMHLLKKKFLSPFLPSSGLGKYFFQDVAINFLGFIPLGFFISLFVFQYISSSQKQTLILTTLFCFSLSLSIELLQAWIPSRSSQLLDVLFNSLGAVAGALCFIKFCLFKSVSMSAKFS